MYSNYKASLFRLGMVALAIGAISACVDSGGGDGNTDPDPSSPYQVLNPSSDASWSIKQAPQIKDVYYSGSKYFAVGGYSLRTSTDGVAWAKQVIPNIKYSLGEIAANGTNMVLGSTHYSTDAGVTWKESLAEVGCGFGAGKVFHDGSQFISLVGMNTVCWSLDGASWTVAKQHPVTYAGMAHGAGKYVLLMGQAIVVANTADAIAWIVATTLPATPGTYTDVIFANGLFVAVTDGGKIVTSADGDTWVDAGVTGSALYNVSYSAGGFIAVGNGGTIHTSADGLSWSTKVISGLGSKDLVAASLSGASAGVVFDEQGTWYTSSDLNTWGAQAIAPRGRVVKVVDNAGMRYVLANEADPSNSSAIDRSAVYRTTDGGINWTRTELSAELSNAYDLIFDGTRFVVSSDNAIGYSSDALTWTTALNYNPRWGGTYLYGIPVGPNEILASTALGSTKYYVGVGGTILTTTDSIDYMVQASQTTEALRAVAANNGTTVVSVGDNGTIVVFNGTSWSVATSGVTDHLVDVVWTGSTFVVAGPRGAMLTSPDGVTWTSRALPDVNGYATDLLYNVGTLLTVHGSTISSSDATGVTWTDKTPFNTVAVSKLGFAGSTYYAFGSATRLVSADGATWSGGSHTGLPNYTRNIGYDVGGDRLVAHLDSRSAEPFSVSVDGGSTWVSSATMPTGAEFLYITDGVNAFNIGGEIAYTVGTPDTYVAGSAYSQDGVNWTLRKAEMQYYDTGLGYLLDFRQNIDGLSVDVYQSTDGGTNWTLTAMSGLITPLNMFNLPALTKVNGQFVIFLNGQAYTSADALNWTEAGLSLLFGMENISGDIYGTVANPLSIGHDGSQYILAVDASYWGYGVLFITSTNLQSISGIHDPGFSGATHFEFTASGYNVIGEQGLIASRNAVY